MPTLTENYTAVTVRIRDVAARAGRAPDSVQLLAVSKTFPARAVRDVYELGQRRFGESYVDEAVDKIQTLRELTDIEWHFIGPIQSNKTRRIAEHFDWVHSVDRLKIARRLNEQRPASMPPLNICIQINISGETSKSGATPAEAIGLARAVQDLPRLRLRGIMGIPAPSDDPKIQHAALYGLAEIYRHLQTEGFPLDTLSMGMSADMDIAIMEGSTMVRIGTAIFGQRDYSQ